MPTCSCTTFTALMILYMYLKIFCMLLAIPYCLLSCWVPLWFRYVKRWESQRSVPFLSWKHLAQRCKLDLKPVSKHMQNIYPSPSYYCSVFLIAKMIIQLILGAYMFDRPVLQTSLVSSIHCQLFFACWKKNCKKKLAVETGYKATAGHVTAGFLALCVYLNK